MQGEGLMNKNNDHYQQLFNEINHPIIIIGPDFKVKETNKATCKATGKTEKEIIGKRCHDIFHTDGKPPQHCPMQSLLKSNNKERAVMEIEALGGYYLVDCNPVFDDSGELRKVIHTATDVTSLRDTQKAFERAQSRFKTYIENAPNGVFIADQHGRYIEVNHAACEITGFREDELLKKNIADILPEEDREIGWALFYKAADEGRSSGETAFLTKNGEKRYWQVNSVKLSDDRYMCFVIDITEKQSALSKQLASEIKFRALYENAPLPYQSLDITGYILDVNPSWLNTLGYKREEVIGSDFSQFLHPDWVDHFRKNFPVFKKQGYIHDVQFQIRHKKGHYLYITFEGYIGSNPDGSFNQTYCVFKEITKQKKAEENLIESERKNRTLIGNLPGMAYRCQNDQQWTMEFISEGCQRLTGYRPDEIVNNKVVSYGSLIHPADRKDVWNIVQNAIDKASHFEIEYRIITKNKEEKWIWERGLCISTTADGTNILEGFMSDITERKQAEHHLKQIEWMLSSNKKEGRPQQTPEYGDLTQLNERGLILSSVGKAQLQDIASEYLELLETSAAVYERNGDYAQGIFASGWCQLMDSASRKLCNTKDNKKALESGKWLCHESCWQDASKESMNKGTPVDIPCAGGINLYAAPVRANGEIVGSINIGYGDPPKDEQQLKKLSRAYSVPLEELRKRSEEYPTRPQFIIDLAKKRLRASAIYLGNLIERNQAETELRKNKHFLDAVFESIQDGISVINPDLTIRHTNGIMKKWFHERLPLEGKKCYACYHNATQPCDPCPTVRAMKTGKTEENIVPGYPGSSLKSIELYSYPLRDPESNRITGVVEFVRDITDKVEATEKLKASEERFELAMKASQDGLFDWYTVTNEVFLSPMWKKILGYEDHELPNDFSVWEKLTHPDDLQKAWVSIQQLLNGKRERFDIEFRMKHKAGHWVYILSRAEGIFDEGGNAVRVVGTHLDITDLKSTEYYLKEKNEEHERLNEELRQTNEELLIAKNKAEESDRLKSAFLANMSHEIRTPMNGIIGFTDILKEPYLQEELRQKYISIIQKSGQRLQNTVNDLIEISKIETGQINVFTEQVNIVEVVQNQYDFFAPEAKAKGLQMEMHLPPGKDALMTETDISKLESVLTNLIKNAIKYTQKGRIDMGMTIYKKHLLFYVKDTGMGVPAARQEAIFNRFEQADIEDTQAFEGSGLGLAISKSYLELLGGQIWVESQEGEGSCFYFTLPYYAAKQKQPAEDHTGRALLEDIKNKQLTVLIAEDEEASDLYLHEILKNYIKKIHHTKNGRETLEWVKLDPDIDIVLMDIKMPVMDGYEATRKIREFNKEVKIIAQTAYALEGDREKALEAGCDAYVAKPINKEKLFSTIRYLMQ